MPRETQLDEEKIGMEEDVRIEAKHDYSPIEAEAIEDRLYEYNRGAARAHDGRTLGHVRRDSAGSIVGAAYGYSWAGISELKQLWVDADTNFRDTGERC
jgi:hypothetical protein